MHDCSHEVMLRAVWQGAVPVQGTEHVQTLSAAWHCACTGSGRVTANGSKPPVVSKSKVIWIRYTILATWPR